MGGAYYNYTVHELLFGYTSIIAEKINGGDYFAGADYDLVAEVTPVFNDLVGVIADATTDIYTGSNGVDEVSKVRLENGVAYTNKIFNQYNGTYYTPVPLNPDTTTGYETAVMFKGASNGV